MRQVIDNALNQPVEIFASMSIVLLAAIYLRVYAERRWRPLKKEEEDVLRVIVGATLTLLGLIVGFSFSMAVSRYEQRKEYEEAEANAIGTEFLRADLLPPAARENAKRMLRSYLDLRIVFYEERRESELARIDAQTTTLDQEMWSVVGSAAAERPTPVIALATAGMNDVFNSQGFTQAAWWNRIPEGAWALMAAIAISCCVLIGYGAHVTRSPLLFILPVILAVAFFFIADIDSPRHGLIQVVPKNLVNLSQALHSSRPSS